MDIEYTILKTVNFSKRSMLKEQNNQNAKEWENN